MGRPAVGGGTGGEEAIIQIICVIFHMPRSS